MNNDSNTIKSIQENNENKKCDSFYKINIIKPIETESLQKTPYNNINKLFLTPTLKKRHTKSPMNNMKESILLSKKSKFYNFEPKENLKVNLLKTKTFKEKSKEKDKDKVKKKFKDKNISKLGQDLISFGNFSPKRKKSINYNLQINHNNPGKKDSLINMLRYANTLYEDDDHLKKDLLTKKIDMNNFSNTKRNSELFMSGRINHLFQKKKLIISFGLKEQNDNLNQNKENSNIMPAFKRKISSISKGRSSNEVKDKKTFSNYLQINQKFKTPNKEKEKDKDKEKRDQEKNHSHKNNDGNKINNNNSNRIYKANKDGDITSKGSKFYLLREKTYKIKNNCVKILEETNNDLVKTNQKNKSKKKENINNNKNPTHDFDITKRESSQKEKDNINKKKKKICFLCCFNPKESDSDEI